MIPLGLLRGVFSNTNTGPKSNKMPFVFTNPPKDTELFSCDKVFVLSQTPVRISQFKGRFKGFASIYDIANEKEDSRGCIEYGK